jgi:cell filamentation protein
MQMTSACFSGIEMLRLRDTVNKRLKMKAESIKISIRFFNDREVRAIWDDEHAKWWFSIVDIVGILNDEQDYVKAGNYWRWLKRKLLKANVQFVSDTHKLKLTAADGKKYLTDTLDSNGISELAKHY